MIHIEPAELLRLRDTEITQLRSQLAEVTKERDEIKSALVSALEDQKKTIANLEETRADYAAVAHAAGVEDGPSMGPSYPGPVDAVVARILELTKLSDRVIDAEVERDAALARAEHAEASAAAMREVLLDVLNEGIDGEYDESTPHRTRAALAPTAGSDLLAEVVALREVERAARNVPIARTQDDFTGLVCAGCRAGPGGSCADDCWALRLKRAVGALTAARKGGRGE